MAKSRLNVTLRGALDEARARGAVDAVASESAKLAPGFEVGNDISEFGPLSQDAVDAIADGKQILAENGARALVRVTGESVAGTV